PPGSVAAPVGWAAAVFAASPAGWSAAEHAATPNAAASISARARRCARRRIGAPGCTRPIQLGTRARAPGLPAKPALKLSAGRCIMAVMPVGAAGSLDHFHRQRALGPVTSLGSANEGAAGADRTGLDHAEPLIGRPGGRRGAPRRRRTPG